MMLLGFRKERGSDATLNLDGTANVKPQTSELQDNKFVPS